MAIRIPITFQIVENGGQAREESLQQALRDPIKIGKSPTSRIRLSDDSVSRNHAVIDLAGANEIFIIDVGSATGTFVNDQKINKAALKSGDVILIGTTQMTVNIGAAFDDGTGVGPQSEPAPAPTAALANPFAAPVSNPFEVANPFAAPVVANPFAAPVAAPVQHAHAAHDDGPEDPDSVIYGINPAGPPVTPDEVETAAAAVEVVVMWGDNQVMSVEHISPPRTYFVGDEVTEKGKPLCDYFIGSEVLGVSRMPVVVEAGGGVAVVIPSGATGEVIVGEHVMTFEEAAKQGRLQPCGAFANAQQYTMPAGAMARVNYRGITFVVKPTAAGRPVGMSGGPLLNWKEQVWTIGSFALFGSFLLLMYFMPPMSSSLSLDLLDADSRLAKYLIQPPETLQEEVPDFLQNEKKDDEGGKGKRAKDDEGQMGKKDNQKTKNKFGIQGPQDNTDPHQAREEAKEQAKNAGILGVLKASMGSWNSPTSPYGRDSALGNDAMSAMGALMGDQTGENFGFGGLGLRGTGRGGGGTGEGTIGLGNIGTIGHGGGGGDGNGYGHGAGGFSGRASKAPRIRQGTADVRGSLSKEVIKRVIQRHLNEVRFCYEQQLNQRPDLRGRIIINFIISPTGAVQGSAVQESDMGSPPVENCIAGAVRRWAFPAPEGGGIVIVNYPFVLEASGGEGG